MYVNDADAVIDMCKNQCKQLLPLADQVETYSLIHEKAGVFLNKDDICISQEHTEGSSVRLVRGNNEYYLYYPVLNIGETNSVEKVLRRIASFKHINTFSENKEWVIKDSKRENCNDYKGQLIKKAEAIKQYIEKMGKDIRITDFQLTFINKTVSIVNTSKTVAYLDSPEFTFEVEIQRKKNGETTLGSCYLYGRSIEDISMDTIIDDISFPLVFDTFSTVDSQTAYDYVVFGHPITASILENIAYYDLIKNPVSDSNAWVELYDDPLIPYSVNYLPFDDFGKDNREVLLYGNQDSKDLKQVKSFYKVAPKNIHRDIRIYPCIQPSNLTLRGDISKKEDIYSDIGRGLYCHLIVGNHYCSDQFVEGTVFNGFEIRNGRFHKALFPFKIRIDKRSFLKSIYALGDDYRQVRPFPWWTPVVTVIPTVFTKGLRLL